MLKTRVRPGLALSRNRAIEEENERYNPIRPSNGNMVMKGGSDVVRSSRTPRLSMADSRALEIQRRHETPGTGATPTMGVSEVRGGAYERYVGGAAVPTMGLSEFRGGYNPLLDHTNVSRSGAYEGQGRLREKSMPPVAMRGGKYHRDGHALSEHMLATMGAAAHKKLIGGMLKHAYGCHGGAWWDDLRRGFEDFGAKVKNEFVNPESILRGKVLPVAAKVGNVLAPVINAAGTAVGVPGVGTAISTGLNAAQGVNQEAKNIGYGRVGCGKKKRAPASAGDGRRKRADIVRKVMAERGVKMIEASKIVKAEGLY